MVYLYVVTGLALAISAIADRRKTLVALKTAALRFWAILPAFAVMMACFSVSMFFFSDEVVVRVLGTQNRWSGLAAAAAVGSITLMPGFIAFPLCGELLARGASYMVLSAFSTTLMSVGVLTYPLERQYFGVKVTLVRNALAMLIGLTVAMVTGIVFQEFFQGGAP